jgi:hypothetical protein
VVARDRGKTVDAAAGRPFTNFQWYFSNARNTVFFGAFTREALTEAAFLNAVRAALAIAPQLNWRQDYAAGRHVNAAPFPVEAIVRFEEVDSFDGFPDKVLSTRADLFDNPALPNFRAACFALKRGSADGHRTFVLFHCSHALMEGADSSALVRGLTSVHELEPKTNGLGLAGRIGTGLAAAILAPANLIMARFGKGHVKQSRFETLTVGRDSLKAAATRYGVQQRSLLFAAVLYGLYYHGGDAASAGKARLIGYTKLAGQRFAGDDDFMKLRVHMARVKSAVSFADYVKGLDGQLEKENRNAAGMQLLYNSVLGVHKFLQRIVPAAYDGKFFSFVPYDFVFSLVPPHLETGRFAGLRFDAIFCGTYASGANAGVMVPYRDGLSFTFYADEAVRARLGHVAALLDEIGVPARTWSDGGAAEDRLRPPAVA